MNKTPLTLAYIRVMNTDGKAYIFYLLTYLFAFGFYLSDIVYFVTALREQYTHSAHPHRLINLGV